MPRTFFYISKKSQGRTQDDVANHPKTMWKTQQGPPFKQSIFVKLICNQFLLNLFYEPLIFLHPYPYKKEQLTSLGILGLKIAFSQRKSEVLINLIKCFGIYIFLYSMLYYFLFKIVRILKSLVQIVGFILLWVLTYHGKEYLNLNKDQRESFTITNILIVNKLTI